ncbi:MAG: hypothetical protein LBR16_09925 [Treponema sp.]|jgi:hypothetical protein|nr:hypothetical protein [Treponema sp.]
MKTTKDKKSKRGFYGPAALLAAAAAAARVLAGVVILAGCANPTGDGGDPDPTVSVVTVTADAAFVTKGGTLQFHAAVAGEHSPSQTVVWSIETTGVASGTTISATGLLTVASGEDKTNLTIKAVSQQDTSKSGTRTVSVVAPNTAAINSVTITGTAAVGETLTATAKDSGSAIVTDATFQWKRADSAGGTYTDISGAASATYTVGSADVGKYLKVTATNGSTPSATDSAATAQVTQPLTLKGRTYYEGNTRIVFASDNTFTMGQAEYDDEENDYVLDTDGHYTYTTQVTGTYTENTAARTGTLTPAKAAGPDGTLLTKSEYKAAAKSYFEEMFEEMTEAQITAFLEQYTGYSTISTYVDAMADQTFAVTTNAYSFSEDGNALFLEQDLPASKGANELSGETLTPSYSLESYTFASDGTFTAACSNSDFMWYPATSVTGKYTVDSSNSTQKKVYLQPVTIDGKTRAQYYETVSADDDEALHYPSAADYKASQTNSAFSQSVTVWVDLEAKTLD